MGIRLRKTEVDNSAERLLCIGLITSDEVCKQIIPILNTRNLTASYSKAIAKWCVAFYEKNKKAPAVHIQDIFQNEKRIGGIEGEAADLVEDLLSDLNDTFLEMAEGNENFNSAYLTEQAENYIQERAVTVLAEDVNAYVSKGETIKAVAELARFRSPERIKSENKRPLRKNGWSDDDEEEESEMLFRYPGALHDLIGPITRGSFISFLAGEKVGKTWMLMDAALRALEQKNNVAFFSIGDMTRKQLDHRLRLMMSGIDIKYPKTEILWPRIDCYYNQNGGCPFDEKCDLTVKKKRVGFETKGTYLEYPDHRVCNKCFRNKSNPINAKEFIGESWVVPRKAEAFQRPLDEARHYYIKKSGRKDFLTFCLPMASASVATIRDHLDIARDQEGFYPDVVIIDYADNLDQEPGTGKLEFRHRINENWMAARRLSQEYNCALIWATQAKTEAKRRGNLEQWDTSEDKRKLSHVTAMLGLSQTPQEKRERKLKISNLAVRDQFFDVEKTVTVLQCLEIGKPIVACFNSKSNPTPKNVSKNLKKT